MPTALSDADRLTELSSCAGCAAKLGQNALREVLRELPQFRDDHLLVGSATSDDAALYRLDRDRAIVQTIDFFTPVVDDPYDYGQVAAANALSDVYAMGGHPITAMNVVGMPTDKVPPTTINRILQGGAAKVMEAECSLVGGHSIRLPEPVYGLSVTGLVNPRRAITNARAQAGDLLVLTKPLGTGVATTAIKRGLASPTLANRVVDVMARLNRVGAALADHGLVRAGTDVTGFGLVGHLGNIVRASDVGAEIDSTALPLLSDELADLIRRGCVPGGTKTNLETAEAWVDFDVDGPRRILCCDAQTSGGLLLCVHPDGLDAVLEMLKEHHTPAAAVVGRLVRSSPRIVVR